MYYCATLLECKNRGYLYLINNQCMENCNDNYYKMEVSLSLGNGLSETFNKCFPSPADCSNDNTEKIFYRQDLKMCWTEYQNGYYIKSVNSNIYELIAQCDNYYYLNEQDHYNYCIDSCINQGLYFSKGDKKCQKSCSLINKSYFDPTNNECLDTCVDKVELKFALSLSHGVPQNCINQCPNYFITKQETINDKTITIYECVDNCPYYPRYKYKNSNTKECIENCPNDFAIDDICYPNCNLDNNYIFINIDTYECSFDCPIQLPQKVKIGSLYSKDIFMCKSACEANQYRLGNECVEKCPKYNEYIGHNDICKPNCIEDPDGEYSYQINEYGGSGYPIYKKIN